MGEVDWDSRAKQGVAFQSVIDPGDRSGLKNNLIDRIQWNHIRGWIAGRRSLLDFGCGVGRFAARVMQVGVKYTGTDSSLEMIRAARLSHRDSAATFEHAVGLPLPFETGRFDSCLTVGVLQCLKTADGVELRRTIAELARVVSPGGELMMIEQASASGGFSGSVSESSTEQDYLDALAGHFDVRSVQRVRLGDLSRAGSLYVRRGQHLPFRGLVGALLARREAAIAARADAAALRRLTYYDLAIVAKRRAEPGGTGVAAGSPGQAA